MTKKLPKVAKTPRKRKVFVVIEEYPDYESEIRVFGSRAKADKCVALCLKDFEDMKVPVIKEGDTLWVGEADRVSVELREKEVE